MVLPHGGVYFKLVNMFELMTIVYCCIIEKLIIFNLFLLCLTDFIHLPGLISQCSKTTFPGKKQYHVLLRKVPQLVKISWAIA